MLTSSLARVAIGAEAQGRAKVTARVAIGAEARGSTGTRALVAIGAETGGAFADNLTYDNGFAHRIIVEVPAERIEATTTGFLFYFDETYPELRTTGNGGLVQNSSGFDQRWTLGDDTVLAYRRVSWSATTGRHIARVLIPSVTAGQPVRLILYFGKSVASDEQQATAAYAGYALALNTRTGEDLTGQGRDLTPTSVGTGTLIGDAGSFNGTTSRLERAGLTALDGLPAITVEAWVNASSIGHSGAIVAGGPTTATADRAMGVVLRFDKVGNDTSGTNCVAFKVQCSDGTTRFESAPNSQPTGPAYLAGVYQPGQAPRVWLNNAFLAQVNTPVIRSGTVSVVRGGSLWVGFSPITDLDETVAPPPSGLFFNPFNKWSAHHRPLGKDLEFGIPPSVAPGNVGTSLASDYDAGVKFDGTNEAAARGRLAGASITMDLETSIGGTKYLWRLTDANKETLTFANRDAAGTFDVTIVKLGTSAYYPIRTASDATKERDYQVLVYPKNAGSADILVSMRDVDYFTPGALPPREWPLGDIDIREHSVPKSFTGASRVRWPMGFVRGFEVNPTNPGPINHALQASACRQDVPAEQQILGKRCCWPSYGTDNIGPGDNSGDIPYGTCVTLQDADYTRIRAAMVAAGNNRGKVIVDTIYFYGIYIIDGSGAANQIQLRCDADVGYEPSATGAVPAVRPSALTTTGRVEIAGVRNDLNAALAACQRFLWPVYNPQRYGTTNAIRQVDTDGLPYLGGGGPRDGKPLATTGSKNTAYDA